MVGVNNVVCSCGKQMIFQPVKGSFFCGACGQRYWILDEEDEKEQKRKFWELERLIFKNEGDED